MTLSRNSRVSPNALSDSRRALSTAVSRSSGVATTRMPRPPPPPAAGAGPIGTVAAATRVCRAPRSASLATATGTMPSSRQARAMRTAISPRLAIRSRVMGRDGTGSHPEHAEARRLDRGVQAGRQGQPQNAPGLPRVEDAVVPQPPRRIIRTPLALVALQDRLLEGSGLRG